MSRVVLMTLISGNNSVKGTVNDGMDVEFALKMGKTLGNHYGSPIVVAVDGRNSNTMLKMALMSGIMSVGCDVYDLGMVPTPLMQFYMVLHPEVTAGVTITASFSGQDINGFRVMRSTGIEDPIFVEHSVEEISAVTGQVPGLEVGEVYKVTDFTEKYIDYILSEVDEDKIRAAHLKVCVDCRNTAVAKIVSGILLKLSVECLMLGGDASAVDESRMVKLGHVVKGQGLDLGISMEMDADHCLLTTAEGVPVQGDKTFAILAKSILTNFKGSVVMPVNSSTLMEDVVKENGGTVRFCKIGEQTVVSTVKETNAVLGGDIFGCIVIPGPFCTCDSIEGMVRILEIIAKKGPLAQLVEGLPDYFISRGALELPEEKIGEALERYRLSRAGDQVDYTDGIKVYRDDGWILARHSNLKGHIKVYVQATSKETADRWLNETLEFFKK